jgi:hypothetical protein
MNVSFVFENLHKYISYISKDFYDYVITNICHYAIRCIQVSSILPITNDPPPWWAAEVVHISHITPTI